MNNHTPGPWQVIGSNVYGNGLRSLLPAKGNDAKLMAAAPELLQALLDALPYVEDEIAAAAIRDAIAKATS